MRDLRSLVFRLSRTQRDAIRQLSAETRVRQSEYLREAIEDLLKKHDAQLRLLLEARREHG